MTTLTVDNEFDLEVEGGEGRITYPNGFGVLLYLQLGSRTRWEASLFRAGVFNAKPVTSRLIGLWPRQLSGLTEAKAVEIQEKVRALASDAQPVPVDAMPQRKRTRKPREVASHG